MPLRTVWTPLLALALLQAAPAVAAQASRVKAGPSGELPSAGSAGNGSAAGPGTLQGSIRSVPLLAPALSAASPAPLVKEPLKTAAPVPVLAPSALPAPAMAPGRQGPENAVPGTDPVLGPILRSAGIIRTRDNGPGSDPGPDADKDAGPGNMDERSRNQAGRLFDGSRESPDAVLPGLPDGTASQSEAPAGVLLRRLVDDAVKDGRVSGPLGQEIKRAAYIDPLTGAMNRLYLDEEGDRVLAKHKTLITFKLDWLKEINDAAGHAAGDQFLADTARIVYRLLGAQGLLVRRSPTGFAVFTNLTGRQAELLAETLRAAVALRMAGRKGMIFDAKTHAPLRSTIQLGIAPIAGDYQSTLAAAEDSRQSAKDAGGDLVADARARVLPRQSVARLRRELRALGQESLAGRLEAELSRRPQDDTAAPRRRGRRMSAILDDVENLSLRQAVSDFLFRNRLSGLHNRRWLDENVADLVTSGRVSRYAALDLDKFGDINRALGEAKADRVLTRFGRILAEFAAGRDLETLHLSGEEFCLLIGPKETDVRGLLEGLRQRVADELGPRSLREDGVAGPDGEPLRITVSIGEARLGDAKLDPLELVLKAGERAEQSLVKAKGSGRNKVVLEGD